MTRGRGPKGCVNNPKPECGWSVLSARDRLINDVLAQVESTGEKMNQAEIIRLKGEVLLMHDTTSAA